MLAGTRANEARGVIRYDMPQDLPPYARRHHPDVQAVIGLAHAASDEVETVLARHGVEDRQRSDVLGQLSYPLAGVGAAYAGPNHPDDQAIIDLAQAVSDEVAAVLARHGVKEGQWLAVLKSLSDVFTWVGESDPNG